MRKQSRHGSGGHAADNEIAGYDIEPFDSEAQKSDSVTAYFNDLKRFPLLNPEEEKALTKRVAAGDKTARKQMIEANLRLVISIAKRYVARGLPLQDLIEEGNIGLIKSVERFKPSMGCRFSTYSTYWIRQAVERAIANQASTIRLPIHLSSDMSKLNRVARSLAVSLQRDPSLGELAEASGLSGRYVKKLNSITQKVYSLDASASGEEDEIPLSEKLPDEALLTPMEIIDEARRSDRIKLWLALLDDTERTIIRLRFGFDGEELHTLDAIGKLFGITRERVRQLEVKALARLRKILDEAGGSDERDLL
ncbi:MAG: hypothetical protein A3J24_06865 [Deltaproteobacteria bacterium RIFCSPLOWO2_02_FULL_53_8]|nr:MAG: hypothetical protein A3J24_06865 [Deltaproteobacteria bacterium RIFCSPLOWO2_02_FULL_53_8]